MPGSRAGQKLGGLALDTLSAGLAAHHLVDPADQPVDFAAVDDYRLHLDFKHGNVVRTAEFTVVAGEHGHG